MKGGAELGEVRASVLDGAVEITSTAQPSRRLGAGGATATIDRAVVDDDRARLVHDCGPPAAAALKSAREAQR